MNSRLTEMIKNRHSNKPINIEVLHKHVKKLLHKTNSFLNSAFNGEVIYDGKQKIDLPFFATETDIEAAKIIKNGLSIRFPQVGFISEEEQFEKHEKTSNFSSSRIF